MNDSIPAVETALPPRGGSYLADPETGALTPLFMPDCGMDPDATEPVAAQEIPETPAPDAENEEPT